MSKSRGVTKAGLARAVTQRSRVAAKDVKRVLESLAEVVLEELSPEGPGVVTLAGPVRAEVVPLPERSERAGRNPATGEAITIAARWARPRGRVRLRLLKPLRDVL